MYRNAAGLVVRITGKRTDGRISYEGIDGRLHGGVIPGTYELFEVHA